MVDVLASRGDERRGSLRYAPGSWQSSFDPEISECGNAAATTSQSPAVECIDGKERTQGTETSKYLEEKKETSIPSVAASESGNSPNRDSSRGCGRLEGLQNHR